MDVVLPKVAPLEADLTYPEHLVKILDQKDCVTTQDYHVLQGIVQ
jgi:hypothetical protein